MLIEEDSEFFKMISTCYLSNLPDDILNNSAIKLLYASIHKDKTDFMSTSQDSFNLLQQISSRLNDTPGDLEFVICSLSKDSEKQLPEEKISKLNWVVNLFNSLAYEKHANIAGNYNKPELKVRLLNQWYGANINNFGIIKDIIEETHIIKITKQDDYDLVLDGAFGSEIYNNKAIKISYSGEAIPPKLEGYDLSLGFDYFKSEHYVRLPLYYLYFGDLISTDFKRNEECNPDKPYFACFLVSNAGRGDGAEARTQVCSSLSSYKPVVSGGVHLNNIGKIIPHEETYEFLSQCKFVIAYENNGTYPGYVTEKVFQAYFAGSIPLYYSHPSGQQSDLNPNAIISAQSFSTEREMINRIIEVDQDDQQYCKIWNSPIIIDKSRNYEVIKAKIREKLQVLLQGDSND